MRVNAIQGTDSTGTQTTTTAVQGEDFSSYLQTTASLEEIFAEAAEKYNVPKNLIKAERSISVRCWRSMMEM